MKRLAALAFLLFNSVAFAELSDFDFMSEAKLLDQKISNAGDKKTTSQQWAYDVTMTNKSTKDFGNLKIKYIIFIKDAKEGSKGGDARLVRKSGATNADSIKAHAKYNFQTDKVDLTKSQLINGFVYTNGGRPRAADSMAGIWVRVYDGEKQIAEFSNPTSIPMKEKWDVK